MYRVIHLLRSSGAVARLDRAVKLTRAARIANTSVRADSWDDVLRLLGERPGSIAVVDPYWSGSLDLEELARVVAHSRLTGAIAYGRFADRPAGHDPSALREAGVRIILTLDVDDAPEEVAAAIRKAVGEPVLYAVVEPAFAALSWKQRIMVRWATREGWRPLTVEDLAGGLGVTPRTLRRWCAGYPQLSPSRLLCWGRVLHACRLISQSGLSPNEAARILGFSSLSDLHRKYRRLVGRRLSDDPKGKLFHIVAHAMVAAVRGQKAG